jgi:TnpA family transposase
VTSCADGRHLADATNAGAERMAESSRGVTIHQMMLMVDRHLRPETYATATAVLVDAQQAHPFAVIWGDGHVSSSDGQFFPAGGAVKPVSTINAKYGKRPAPRCMASCRTGSLPSSPG